MSDDAAALRQRVADLEQQVDRLTPDGDTPAAVPDDQGRTWTVGSLVGEIGLTRRQAIVVLGMLAGGAAFSDALIGAVQAQPTGDEGAVGQSGNRVEVWASELDATEVATEEADVTGETFIQGHRESNVSGVSSGTWTTLATVEDADNLNEQDDSFNINPSESGWYVASMSQRFFDISAGDILRAAVRDVDADSTVQNGSVEIYSQGNSDTVEGAVYVELTAGTDYQVQVADLDSTYSLASGDFSRFTLLREVVHP